MVASAKDDEAVRQLSQAEGVAAGGLYLPSDFFPLPAVEVQSVEAILLSTVVYLPAFEAPILLSPTKDVQKIVGDNAAMHESLGRVVGALLFV